MIRLQKNELETKIESIESLDLEENINLDNLNIDTDNFSPKQNSLDSFSSDVLKSLIDKNIPPLPTNYQAFFEQSLNNCDLDFQKKIHDLMEADNRDDDRNINFEKNIHIAFAKTKDLLKCISIIYRNFIVMNDMQNQISSNLKPENKENSKFVQEVKELQNVVDKHIAELKILYQQCNKAIDSINTDTMYDSKFDVYNKRYFINLVKEEEKAVQRFQHTSTILMMALPDNVTKHLSNEQMALIVMKTIAKLLLKTSRRSDIIGYIGNGIFGMLLKHSDIFSSKKASERLIELLKNTNVFLGHNEINLDLNIGIAKITSTRSAEESLNYSISALRSSQQNQTKYEVYKEDAR